jgi:hypothetical protein
MNNIPNMLSNRRYPHAYWSFKNFDWTKNFLDFNNFYETIFYDNFTNIEAQYDKIIKMFIEEDYQMILELMDKDKILLMRCGTLKESVALVLFVYCIFNNDINLLDIIMQKNLCMETSYHNMFITTYVIKKNNYNMFKILLDNIQFSDKIISDFINYIIKEIHDDLTFINIILDRGHKIHENNIKNAIIFNNTTIIQYLFDSNYDVQSAFDSLFNSTTCVMLSEIKLDTIKIFHNNINITNYVENIFCKVISEGNLEAVMYLIDNFPELDINHGITFSCEFNKVNILKYLLELGGDINCIEEVYILNSNIEIIKFLIEYNYHVSQNILDNLLLLCFVKDQHLDNINYLISHGVNVENIIQIKEQSNIEFLSVCVMQGKYEQFPSLLETVISLNKLDIIKLLTENYLHLIQPQINDLFIISIANGHLEITKYLLNFNVEFDDKTLLFAAFFGHLDMVNYLLELGMNFDKLEENLFEVVITGYYFSNKPSDVYDNLIKNTCFKNDVYNWGKKHYEIIQLLIKYSVPIINEDFLVITKQEFYTVEFFKYIIPNISNVNAKYKDTDIVTLLESSIIFFAFDVTKLLLEYGANPSVYNVVALKIVNENKDIKNLLLAYGYVE